MSRRSDLISVVMPAFNEAAGIQKSIRTLSAVFDALPYKYEIVIVDDGSRDETFRRAAEMMDKGFPVRAFKFSRNFGKEAALLAGLQQAAGGAVITIDADLQHPPSLIPEMIAAWKRGAKVVHGVKRDRGDEPWLTTVRASIVNKLLEKFGGIDMRNSSDFKLLDRAAVDVLTKNVSERRRFYRGLADWIGFEQVTLSFDVAPREHGQSGFSLRSLLALTLTAMISFTSAPLRIVSILGLLTFLLGVTVGSEALWSWFHGNAVSGFATEIFTILIIGSFIMISLGIVGEYIAKIYDEAKQRPMFVIDASHQGAQNTAFGQLPNASMDSQRVSWLSSGALFESTDDAVIIWEIGGTGIQYWNSAATKLYGYSAAEACGKITHHLLKTEIAGGTDELEKKIARYGLWLGELQHTARDGRQVRVQSTLTMVRQDGRWLVMEVNRDVTDQARAVLTQQAVEGQLAAWRNNSGFFGATAAG